MSWLWVFWLAEIFQQHSTLIGLEKSNATLTPLSECICCYSPTFSSNTQIAPLKSASDYHIWENVLIYDIGKFILLWQICQVVLWLSFKKYASVRDSRCQFAWSIVNHQDGSAAREKTDEISVSALTLAGTVPPKSLAPYSASAGKESICIQ